MARRRVDVFSLSFLDAITCGFGAVVLLYMVINANVALRADRLTEDLQGEVDRMQVEVLDGHRNLVELRNSLREVEDQRVSAAGLSSRLLKRIEEIRAELATYDQSTTARQEHINRLMADLRSLEEGAKRLSGGVESEEVPGRRIRAYVGDGDRQYLTGLKVGGRRIVVLLDASTSMLGENLVNIIRRRHLPDNRKVLADKWQQAVATVDWLTTQFPRDADFQIFTFNIEAQPAIPGTERKWLDAGDPKALDDAMRGVRATIPDQGTSLYHAFGAVKKLEPKPDNLILITDGLPTWGILPPRGGTVTGKQRLKMFQRAVKEVPPRVPVNVILFPIEGDPLAAAAFWELALATSGSMMSPAEDWP
jgi:hypothetical protein